MNDLLADIAPPHQSRMDPEDNKFHAGKGTGRHIACVILEPEREHG